MAKKEQMKMVDTGDAFQFNITATNFTLVGVFELYSKMLDYVTNSDETTELSLDGVMNYILDKYLTKHIRDLSKKHGFESIEEFCDCICQCGDGKQVFDVINQHERDRYQADHDDIFSHIPVRERTLFD